MALTFKGERTVAELNNKLDGFVKDSAFRIYDHGTLLKGNVPVKHGDFVSWTGTQWKIEPSLEYATSADVEAVEEQVESLGKPLQWKGPATVAQLNAGITGIQEGWTYTLTDAGTLTDGSIAVEAGDEVAWTEDGEWFKVGGDSSKIAVFECTYSQEAHGYVHPTANELNDARIAGKLPVIVEISPVGNRTYYVATQMSWYMNNVRFYFVNSETGAMLKLEGSSGNPVWSEASAYDFSKSSAIAPEYDSTATYAVGDAVMHNGLRYECNTAISTAEAWDAAHWTKTSVEDVIGNVETLLAAL